MATSIGSDTLAAAIRAATADDRVGAIVLRVNSPGGSYVASDTIWREVVRARAAAKPVVVSMGDMAASGGYFISMAADVIVAEPGTLTGSIGVFGGKPVLSGLLEQGRSVHRRGPRRRAGADVLHQPSLQPGRVGAGERLARPHLRRLHREGRGGPQADRRAGPRGRPRPGLDRRRRGSQRAGRPAWRAGRGGADRAAPRRAARGRAGPPLPTGQPAGPAARAAVERGPRSRGRTPGRGPARGHRCSPRARGRSRSSRPGSACRQAARCCCRATG